jgi:EAL domain-containing protein (putative c-di-GMP-specific phosphodiesterase class I)
LHFQPIVAAESGRIVGAEALLRWRPPEGDISPAVFIPIAEMTGAIVPIGAWVFRQACRAEAAWRARWGAEAPYVSVNLSTRQLSEESLADDFARMLAETTADPTRLLLEITETSLMADVDANLRVLRRLAALGLRVAVDDFGTGYSSLAQLTRMPVDVLKIDRAFVDGIDKSEESRTLIRAVIGLGRALGLKLVAEGVETAAQQRELCVYGCDFIQGYYFHRPQAEAAFIDTVERQPRGAAPGMPAPIYFVLYVSRATQPMTSQTLAELQKQSRDANRAAGISGCLLYQDGCFLQMIEGQRETLLALLDRIKADPRHRDFKLIIEGPVTRRIFRDWGMALRDLSQTPELDFAPWQQRKIDFYALGEDARACYDHITAFACDRLV